MLGSSLELQVPVTEDDSGDRPEHEENSQQEAQLTRVVQGEPEGTDKGGEAMQRSDHIGESRHGAESTGRRC